MDDQTHREVMDRRSHDPRILALMEKVDTSIITVSRHSQEINELQRKVDRLEIDQRNAIKDVDDHHTSLKTVNVFIAETKAMHRSFEEFIKSQQDTNKIFMEAQAKTSKFQNNILVVGAVAWFLWQVFGNKLFSAAEVLVK
jgi:phage host-nuclease inhibitor protein Gam